MNGTSDHRLLRESLGAYALAQLPPDESARLDQHLAGCATCPAELAELRPAVAALALARSRPGGGAAEASPEPAHDLGHRIDARISSERQALSRSRSRRSAAYTMLGAAAAALVLLVGLRLGGTDTPTAVPLEAVGIVDQQPGVAASADLVDHTWGVEVKLVASGLQAGAQYDVTVLGAGGAAYPAGAFVGTGAKPVKCNLNAGVLRAQATGFEVRDASGAVVLRSNFPGL